LNSAAADLITDPLVHLTLQNSTKIPLDDRADNLLTSSPTSPNARSMTRRLPRKTLRVGERDDRCHF
jgi:hypothetical protein